MYKNNKALDRMCVEMIQTDSPFKSVTADIRGKQLSVAAHSDVGGTEECSLAIQLQTQIVASIDVCGSVFKYKLAKAVSSSRFGKAPR